MDLAGVTLDERYRVIEPIASGAMGTVYKAERLKLGRIVAIKVLHDVLPDELSSKKRFEIEAMAMAKLEHPHCAAVVDVGVYEGKPYVVMDFVSGDNLKTLMSNGPLPPARAVDLVRQVLSGLAHAHEQGIVHRDVKPANIVLSQKAGLGDHVKILDFGLAKFASSGPRLTQGIAVGTPSYMAPEQGSGAPIDARTDLYAVGVMLYEMLVGAKPFYSTNDDPVEVVRMHLNKPAPRLDPKFGPLVEVVARALAKKPAERFQSAEEFAAALRGGSQPVITLPDGKQELSWSVPPEALPDIVSQPVAVASQPAVVASSQIATDPTELATKPLAPPPAPVAKSFPMKRVAMIGGGVLLLIIVIAVVASRGGSTETPAEPPVAKKVEPPPTKPTVDGANEAITRAQDLIANNHNEEALRILTSARTLYPTNATLATMAGKLYFAKLWFDDGLGAFRVAVKADPSLAQDPEMAKAVLRGFIASARYDRELANYLHDVVGPSAKPLLEDTAKTHPNAIVRKRAREELKRY